MSHKLCKNIIFNTFKKHIFWIFVRIALVIKGWEFPGSAGPGLIIYNYFLSKRNDYMI